MTIFWTVVSLLVFSVIASCLLAFFLEASLRDVVRTAFGVALALASEGVQSIVRLREQAGLWLAGQVQPVDTKKLFLAVLFGGLLLPFTLWDFKTFTMILSSHPAFRLGAEMGEVSPGFLDLWGHSDYLGALAILGLEGVLGLLLVRGVLMACRSAAWSLKMMGGGLALLCALLFIVVIILRAELTFWRLDQTDLSATPQTEESFQIGGALAAGVDDEAETVGTDPFSPTSRETREWISPALIPVAFMPLASAGFVACIEILFTAALGIILKGVTILPLTFLRMLSSAIRSVIEKSYHLALQCLILLSSAGALLIGKKRVPDDAHGEADPLQGAPLSRTDEIPAPGISTQGARETRGRMAASPDRSERPAQNEGPAPEPPPPSDNISKFRSCPICGETVRADFEKIYPGIRHPGCVPRKGERYAA